MAPSWREGGGRGEDVVRRRCRRLDLRGAFESAEADDIRERMETPWYAMTDEEQTVARRVSAALNTEEERLKRARPLASDDVTV